MINSVAYGPVPSRRLGHSLGVNNIPPKTCSYSCVYCQLGITRNTQIERQRFYEPEDIANSVKCKINQARGKSEPVDYITFVPDGEPTLDANLGKEIELLKECGIKIAVITNASLIWQEDVRRELHKADWVSFKIDAVSKEVWRKIDRPHKLLNITKIMEGMLEFRDSFKGCLATESMLIQDYNDTDEEINLIADFLAKLEPDMAYISVPVRPPAIRTAIPAAESTINEIYQILRQKLVKVECLLGYEGNAFAYTGNIENDLLSITAVHPMREDGVAELLRKAGGSWDTIKGLIREGMLTEVEYLGRKYYLRKLRIPAS